MSYRNIALEEDEGVATITLNRPDRFNSLNLEMGRELVDTIEKCARDARVKAVVITGAGRAFCAGGDLKAARDSLDNSPSGFFGELTKFFHRVILDIRMMPKSVIASVNGAAAGAGFSLALACDLRIASDKATFKQAYTSVGLVPDGGLTFHLPRLVGLGKASELVLLDRSITAGEAEELGLVNKVVPEANLKEATSKVAKQLAKGPTLAFARAKALLNQALISSLESQLEIERQGVVKSSETEDFREAVLAFFKKRKPEFKGK